MNYRKLVVCGDTHGDKRDAKAVRLFKAFCEDYKPEIRIHLGDFMNAEAFRNGANEWERRVGLKDDTKAALEFLEWYKPSHLLWGNHDDRLPLYVRHSPGPLADYVAEIIGQVDRLCEKIKCEQFPYDKRKGVARIGRLKCLHGFFCGSNAAKQTALAYGSCVFGHTHRFSSVSVPGAHSGGRAVARGIGSLCSLDMEYNSRHVDTLSQANGWSYGVMDKGGRYWLANAEIVNGSVMVSDNFKILG
jgi:predicted phosphodiesterase